MDEKECSNKIALSTFNIFHRYDIEYMKCRQKSLIADLFLFAN